MRPQLLQVQFTLSDGTVAHASFGSDGIVREIVGYIVELSPAQAVEAGIVVARLTAALESL